MKNFAVIVSMMFLLVYLLPAEWKLAEIKDIGGMWEPDDSTFYSLVGFEGIDCADSANCIALDRKFIYKSTDGGRTWYFAKDTSAIPGAVPDPIYISLSFPTKNLCLIGAEDGIILKTTNMGKDWKKIETIFHNDELPYNYKKFFSIRMYDSLYGVAFCGKELLYTRDGGENWEIIPPADTNYGIGARQGVVIWSPNAIGYLAYCRQNRVCDYEQAFFVSTDTGKTWSAYKYDIIGKYYTEKIYFYDTLFGCAVGGEPTGKGDQRRKKIGITKDGGKTWELKINSDTIPPIIDYLLDVSFHNRYLGYAVNGAVLKTTDGGETWFSDWIVPGYTPKVYVCYRNVKKPLLADYYGRIWYYEEEPMSASEGRETEGSSYYPNPVRDILHFGEIVGNVEVFSLEGVKLMEERGVSQIDVSKLAQGLYFVRLNSIRMQKFVKLE
jgi:photosystem II stability/assembly factor-like uncharacterized protein